MIVRLASDGFELFKSSQIIRKFPRYEANNKLFLIVSLQAVRINCTWNHKTCRKYRIANAASENSWHQLRFSQMMSALYQWQSWPRNTAMSYFQTNNHIYNCNWKTDDYLLTKTYQSATYKIAQIGGKQHRARSLFINISKLLHKSGWEVADSTSRRVTSF